MHRPVIHEQLRSPADVDDLAAMKALLQARVLLATRAAFIVA